MKTLTKIIIFTTLIMLISCSKKPKFIKIDNIVVKGIKDSLMEVNMDYVVYNPNNVKTKLKESVISLYYKDNLVGKGELSNNINLKSKDTIKIPVLCNIKLHKLSLFYPEMLNSDSTAFQIKGENKIGFLLNSFKTNVNEKIYINTKKIIREEINKNLGNTDNFKIKSIEINALPSFKKTTFKIIVETKNNLSFDYKIEHMKLEFFLDNKAKKSIANWSMDKIISLKAFETNNMPLDVTIDNHSMMKFTNISMLFKQKIDFIVKGQVQIKIQDYIFNVPVNDKMKIDIKKFVGF